MKVVSNAGPLIAFGKLGRLDLLVSLYGQLIIPPEVQQEIRVGVQKGHSHSGAIAAMIEANSIEVVSAVSTGIEFQRPINLGEVGAIGLAIHAQADLVLIDDQDARYEAERLGLKVKGTIGVVLAALDHKLISDQAAIKLLMMIQARSDIWISRKVIQSAIDVVQRSQVGR